MVMRKVLVIDEFDTDLILEHSLSDHGFQVATLKLQDLELLQVVQNLQPDVVVLNLYSPTDAVLDMMIALNQQFPVPVIMFAEDQQSATINKVIKAGVSAYIVEGLEPRRIKAIIDIAIARFNDHKALKDELQKTKNQLEERKLIDRAKAILIKSKDYNEDQAYHALRKLAMDRKISIGEMAKNVISVADLLK